MEARIETLGEKKLAGIRLSMSFANNKTKDLWQGFMPMRKQIVNAVDTYLYSLEVYPERFFNNFDATRAFEKWAAIEVSDFEHVPAGMEPLILKGGLYAVFLYKGPASAAGPFYQSIFNEWLPNSGYIVDERPHFALMGDKYKNENPGSEEEIWLPVKEII